MPSAAPSPLLTVIAMAAPLTIETVCDGARHAAYLGGYCAAKLPLGIKPLPPMGRDLMTSDHAQFAIGLDVVIMVDIV